MQGGRREVRESKGTEERGVGGIGEEIISGGVYVSGIRASSSSQG